jgi:hypothetical protein
MEIAPTLGRKHDPETVLDYGRTLSHRGWPLFLCGVFVVFSALLQFALLPCLCGDNGPKLEFAAALDILFVVRCGFAFYFKEQRGWLIYGLILLSSAFWIESVLTSATTESIYNLVGIHSYRR